MFTKEIIMSRKDAMTMKKSNLFHAVSKYLYEYAYILSNISTAKITVKK